MNRPFREHHLLKIFELYEEKKIPIDALLNDYFRANKSLGSKDRAFIAQNVYGMIRWKALLDYLVASSPNWESRFHKYQEIDPYAFVDDTSIPPHIRVSCPKILYDQIVSSHGVEGAQKICIDSNEPAPTAVRVNTLKTTRDEMLNRWAEHDVVPSPDAPNGIIFQKKIHFTSFPEFKEGCFEMQDEGSQLVGEMVHVQSGQRVMDYCAGAGGKTLNRTGFDPDLLSLKLQNLDQLQPWNG